MRRTEGVIVAAILLGAALLFWRYESAAAVLALATAAAFRWASAMLHVHDVSDEHQRDLHEIRLALATLGDPDKLLRRLDELKERTEKTARLPDKLDLLTEKVQKLVGDTAERLGRLEAFNSKLLTDETLRRRLTFGRE